MNQADEYSVRQKHVCSPIYLKIKKETKRANVTYVYVKYLLLNLSHFRQNWYRCGDHTKAIAVELMMQNGPIMMSSLPFPCHTLRQKSQKHHNEKHDFWINILFKLTQQLSIGGPLPKVPCSNTHPCETYGEELLVHRKSKYFFLAYSFSELPSKDEIRNAIQWAEQSEQLKCKGCD